MSEKRDKNTESVGDATRVSVMERDQAVHQLQEAFGDGRLDNHEYEERMSLALRAKTRAEVDALLFDLSVAKEQHLIERPRASLTEPVGAHVTAIFGGVERKGQFTVPKQYAITAVFGGCHVDLRAARLSGPVTEINVEAIFGGVSIIVPPGIRVETHSHPIFGGVSDKTGGQIFPPDAPVIYIDAKAIFGGIEIKLSTAP